VPPCSLGLQLEKRETVRERAPEIRLRVVRAAEVRPRDVAPADDQLAPLELRPLALVEARHVGPAVRRQQEEPARAEDGLHLVTPRELQLLGQVREDRQRIDEVEACVVECEWWGEPVRLEAREREVVTAPLDRGTTDIAPRDRPFEALEPSRHAPAAAAEVQHRLDP